MKPIIYTTGDCWYCQEIKDWLDEIGVAYEEIDATDMDEIEIVPETHIGDEVLIGFNRQKLLKTLKKHGILN